MHEKREAFYNQIRDLENKKNPNTVKNYISAIRNNNIDEVYKLLQKDQNLVFIADYVSIISL